VYELEIARSVAHVLIDEDYISAMAAAGIRQIEFQICNVTIDEDVKETEAIFREKIALLERYGIRVLSIHLPFGRVWELCVPDDGVRNRAMKRYLELIECCKFIEPKRFVLHPGYPRVPQEEREARIANFRKNVQILAEACAPARIAVENMPQDCLGNTSAEMMRLVDGLPQLDICCDMNHWEQEETTYDAIKVMGSRIRTVHINDYDGLKEKHWLPGTGILDWDRILGCLEEIGYNGPFLYECNPPHDVIAQNKQQLFSSYNGK